MSDEKMPDQLHSCPVKVSIRSQVAKLAKIVNLLNSAVLFETAGVFQSARQKHPQPLQGL
jgi:hypothetical protein